MSRSSSTPPSTPSRTWGPFAALCVFGPGREDDTSIHHYAGFARRRPWVAAAMAIFLFSLAGIPPFAGFAAKFYIFYAAVATGHTALAVVGVLTSVLSVYYYLKVVVAIVHAGTPPTRSPAPRFPPRSPCGPRRCALSPSSAWA